MAERGKKNSNLDVENGNHHLVSQLAALHSYDNNNNNNRLRGGNVCFCENKWAGKVENDYSEQRSHTEVVKTTLARSLRERLLEVSSFFFILHTHTHSVPLPARHSSS